MGPEAADSWPTKAPILGDGAPRERAYPIASWTGQHGNDFGETGGLDCGSIAGHA